ncbi:response regulator [uncultured Nitrospira sp.]|uniref:response regulator n=1 Tax=uncultured Nitrospira sp. TaxID=157176 RepID=UPI0031400C48
MEKIAFEVATVSNGLERLEVLNTESVYGILLDLEMPIMDGLAMLNRLRQKSEAVLVIVLTTDPTRSTIG